MSHGHTHAPGESHSHSHGPPQQQQQQQQMIPPPDPVLQALIDQDFKPVPLALAPEGHMVNCSVHSLEKCPDCNLDFVNLNRLSRLLVANPNLRCPPPSNVISQQLSQAVTNMKDEGNALFKSGNHTNAIAKYSLAAAVAVQRPPWEANQLMREELSTVVSNRSAAYLEAGDCISALADAETVIQLRRNWSKGHYRKAKALVGLGELAEAAEAVGLGLSFEPQNTELQSFLAEIERGIAKQHDFQIKKEETVKPSTTVAAAA